MIYCKILNQNVTFIGTKMEHHFTPNGDLEAGSNIMTIPSSSYSFFLRILIQIQFLGL